LLIKALLRPLPVFSHTSEQPVVEKATNIFILPFFQPMPNHTGISSIKIKKIAGF
jgi:hypothetical protein